MNKHAYLIVAHTNWAQLKLLLGQLDHDTNDIYLHINIKSIDFNAADTKNSVKNAGLFLLDRREVRWGFYSLTEIALDFLETATNRNYNYYHFLTGSDLLIKSNKFVVDFFETHGGHEFVERVYPLSFKWYSRYAYKQILTEYLYLNNYKKILAHVLRNGYSILQKTIGYDKVKRNFNRELMFGSAFWSITHDLASYVVSQKKWIFENYHDTSFPEESFLQTVLEDSPFKNRRYTSSNSNLNDHLRLIQWNRQSYSGRGHPHVWTINDVETIRSSNNLFARKFIISIDRHVIDSIIKMTQ